MNKWIDIIKNYRWQLALPVLAFVLVSGVLLIGKSVQSIDKTGLSNLSEQSDYVHVKSEMVENDEGSSSSEEVNAILVDVKGAVQQPGLYQLEVTARVNDAILAAGGLAKDADPKSVNLAQKLTDEAVVYVATQGEDITVLSPPVTSVSNQEPNKVNINTATEAELQTISGIGAKKAADIIAYRESNGLFKTVDDLNKVSGIGNKSLEKLRAYVTVD